MQRVTLCTSSKQQCNESSAKNNVRIKCNRVNRSYRYIYYLLHHLSGIWCCSPRYDRLCTSFQNDRYFSALLFTCKLALVVSFLNSKFKKYFPLIEATRISLQVNERILKWRPVWNQVFNKERIKSVLAVWGGAGDLGILALVRGQELSISTSCSPLFTLEKTKAGNVLQNSTAPWARFKCLSYDRHICFWVDLAVLFD